MVHEDEHNDDDKHPNRITKILPKFTRKQFKIITSYRPGGRRDDMPPPPMAVRLAADLRPSADGSAVRTPLVAGGG